MLILNRSVAASSAVMASFRPMKIVAKSALRFDARYFQIACLASLLALLVWRGDPGVTPFQGPACLGACLAAQYLLCRSFRIAFDWRSPVITALSLGLLLRADSSWLWIAASALAMASKFMFRVRGKHVFNPANFAIVALLLTSDAVWVSPGQWGDAVWLAMLLASLGWLVLSRAARLDIAAVFLATYGALLLARCLILGDPLAIPIHQMQSGALLLFAFFMLTDPRATPDHRWGRALFAVSVGLLAYHLQFDDQIRPGMFLALAALSPLVPLIDRAMPAPRFTWSRISPS
jgi:Na+-transporting NADH:ubiquinone oxidoreductase subunit NqrB